MKNENKVLACVDQSRYADYVADCAAWAAHRMNAPLEFLHVIDSHPERGMGDDRSGAIGIDAQESLLAKLSAEDETRAKSAREQGRLFLNRLRERAMAIGATNVDVRQRHGDLEETVVEQAKGVRLLVLGRRGADAATSQRSELGHHVEHMVRALNRPILTVTEDFKAPQRVMIAFDGGVVTRRGVEMVAGSPLFRGLPILLLMSGTQRKDASKSLEWARGALEVAGFEVTSSMTPGEAQEVIVRTIQEQAIDMLIMGAFGHSPLRSLVVGSKTTELLKASTIPTLLLR
ncbi:universal stress protein [Pseudomonas aeruginosa]|uniref:universal stress protein n=1 Tax=Pseudomonas aeruginosa TaxID=287 RepID=UPI003EDFFA23